MKGARKVGNVSGGQFQDSSGAVSPETDFSSFIPEVELCQSYCKQQEAFKIELQLPKLPLQNARDADRRLETTSLCFMRCFSKVFWVLIHRAFLQSRGEIHTIALELTND